MSRLRRSRRSRSRRSRAGTGRGETMQEQIITGPRTSRPPMSAGRTAPPPAKATLLALAALLLCLQGARGLWEPDEGRYSAVAWHLAESGHLFKHPLSAALPHFTKPPLLYWLLAGSMSLLGRNEWA